MRFWTIVVSLTLLLFSCQLEVEETYYDTGELKSTITLQDKKQHGVFKEHFKDGTRRQYQEWKNGKLHGRYETYYGDGSVAQIFFYEEGERIGVGKIFHSNGQILERQYYQNNQLIDFEKYDKSGNRAGGNVPLFSLEEDTVKLGEKIVFTIRLGNISDERYKEGGLFITSELINGQGPLDTLEIIMSDSNHYQYTFIASSIGKGQLKGCLQFRLAIDTLENASYLDRYSFIQPYFVKQ